MRQVHFTNLQPLNIWFLAPWPLWQFGLKNRYNLSWWGSRSCCDFTHTQSSEFRALESKIWVVLYDRRWERFILTLELYLIHPQIVHGTSCELPWWNRSCGFLLSVFYFSLLSLPSWDLSNPRRPCLSLLLAKVYYSHFNSSSTCHLNLFSF